MSEGESNSRDWKIYWIRDQLKHSAIQKGNKVEPLLLHLEKNELRWFRHLHFPEQSNVWTFLARHVVWELEANFSVPLSFTSPFIECPTTIPHSSLPVPHSCWSHPAQWEFLCVTHNMSCCSPPVSTIWQCLFFFLLGYDDTSHHSDKYDNSKPRSTSQPQALPRDCYPSDCTSWPWSYVFWYLDC